MNGHEMLAMKAPITFEVACKAWGDDPNFCDDTTRKCFFAVWALLCFEWAEAMVEHEQSRKVAQTAPSVPEGWKSVPVEPTLEMLHAAQTAWLKDPCRKSSTIYRAMVAAAPGAQENNDAPL